MVALALLDLMSRCLLEGEVMPMDDQCYDEAVDQLSAQLAASRALVAEMRQALRESDEAGLRGVGFTSLADLTRWRQIASLTEEDMLKQMEEK